MTRVQQVMMMKPKFDVILEMAIDLGIERGYRRAYKHVETPSEGAVKDAISTEIMNTIYEYFDFQSNDDN